LSPDKHGLVVDKIILIVRTTAKTDAENAARYELEKANELIERRHREIEGAKRKSRGNRTHHTKTS
jgi:hypothetical protein